MLSLKDLADLRDELQRQHFRIAPQQVMAAQQVLDYLRFMNKMPLERGRLAGYLGPILCASAMEQSRFPDLYRDWLKSRFDSDTPNGEDHRSTTSLSLSASTRGIRRMAPSVFALLTLMVCGIVGWACWQDWRMRELTGTVVQPDGSAAAGAHVQVGSRSVTADPAGHFVVPVRFSDFPSTLTAFVPGRSSTTTLIGVDIWQRRSTLFLQRGAANLAPVRITLVALGSSPEHAQITRPKDVASIRDITASSAGSIDVHTLMAHSVLWQRINWTRVTVALSPILVLAVWSIWWLRRRPVLRRRTSATASLLHELFLPGGINDVVAVLPLRRLAQEMRRRRLVQSLELQVERTVEMTMQRMGTFTPVWGSRVEPNYLALVDTVGLSDHQARFAESIINELVRSDVIVDRFVFNGTPMVCYPNEQRHAEAHRRAAAVAVRRTLGAHPIMLEDLYVRYPHHRVLVFVDASSLFDAFTGAPTASLETLQRWAMLFVLTSRPPESWGKSERVLARLGVTVLSLTRSGMLEMMSRLNEESVLNNYAPAVQESTKLTRDFGSRRWLDRDPPSEAEIAALLEDLRADLGDRGVTLLAACAAYPEIHWGITIRLAAELIFDDAAMDTVLPKLTRLVWLREAYMPDWLRTGLLQRLSRDDDTLVRKLLLKMLESVSTTPDQELPLRVSADSSERSDLRRGYRARIKRWIDEWRTRRRARGAIQAANPGSPLRDYVFLQFVSGETLGSLNLSAPERLLRLLFSGGTPLLGFRWPVVAVLAVVGTIALTFRVHPVNFGVFRIIPLQPSLAANNSRVSVMMAYGFDDDMHLAAMSRDIETPEGRVAWTAERINGFLVGSADGRWIASRVDKNVVLWDTETHGQSPFVSFSDDSLKCGVLSSCPAISPGGEYIAYPQTSKTVQIREIPSGRLVRTLSPFMQDGLVLVPVSLAFASRSVLGIGYPDGTIRLVDVKSGSIISTLASDSEPLPRSDAWHLVFSGDGRRVAWSNSAVVTVWDIESKQRLARFGFKPREVLAIALSPDGKMLAASSASTNVNPNLPSDGGLMLFDVVANSTLAGNITAERRFYTGVSFSFDGRWFVTSANDGIVGRWKLPDTLTASRGSAAHALVIHVNQDTAANAVGEVLRTKFGFDVTLLNGSPKDIVDVLEQFAMLVQPQDRVLIDVIGPGTDEGSDGLPRYVFSAVTGEPLLDGAQLISYIARLRTKAKDVLLILDTPRGELLTKSGKESVDGLCDVVYFLSTSAKYVPRSTAIAKVLSNVAGISSAGQLAEAMQPLGLGVGYARSTVSDDHCDSHNFFSAPPATAPHREPLMGPLEKGVNRQGMDLSDAPEADNPAQCAEMCRTNAACKAMTYVISQKRCWLKKLVPRPGQPNSPDFVSSVKVYPNQQ